MTIPIAFELFSPFKGDINEIAKETKLHAFRLWNCKKLSIIHGDSDGMLYLPESILLPALQESDYIVCCYPWAVKRQFSLVREKIVGDWFCQTKVYITNNNTCLTVSDRNIPVCTLDVDAVASSVSNDM